jgi:hypothetical protein
MQNDENYAIFLEDKKIYNKFMKVWPLTLLLSQNLIANFISTCKVLSTLISYVVQCL